MILATHDKPFLPADLTGKFKAAGALGFDAMEVDGALLLGRFEDLLRARDSSGVGVVAACGGYRGWIGHFEEAKRLEACEDLALMLRRVRALGGSGVVAPAAWGMFSLRLPPMVPPRDEASDRAALLDSLTRLEEAAEAGDSYLYLEPLNRYEDHMVNLLETAAGYIEEGGFRRVRIAADFYHMNIEEARIEESLATHAALVGHVHLADSHRYQPGDGHLDFLPGLRALKAAGYGGAFSIECRVRGENPAEAYRASALHVRGLLSAAGFLS
ncbi:MAG: sugar phosphate isomerase/epimerase [Spirochaetales bacterium]|nr:sugar phosphate isomerase/epimerase [Spirochaetales bacterium]